jgi:hypothetical protein
MDGGGGQEIGERIVTRFYHIKRHTAIESNCVSSAKGKIKRQGKDKTPGATKPKTRQDKSRKCKLVKEKAENMLSESFVFCCVVLSCFVLSWFSLSFVFV